MLRVTGYVKIFAIVIFLSFLTPVIPAFVFITEFLVFIIAFLELFGYIIGVREATGLSTRKAFFAAIAADIINFSVVLFITHLVLRAFGISGA